MMRFVLAALRIFLGLFLLANGLNFWFHWLPITPPDSETATRLMDGLVFSGLFGVVKYVEVLAGVLLLANRFVPLALMLMLPLSVVIAYVDFILIGSREAATFAGLLLAPQAVLMLFNLRSYLPMLAMHGAPGLPTGTEVRAATLD
jgi:uncharacterized membrane protein YphA (DoxX/SURF4 family)